MARKKGFPAQKRGNGRERVSSRPRHDTEQSQPSQPVQSSPVGRRRGYQFTLPLVVPPSLY